ncbi:MAG: 4Fe-4S binding protein [Spirochaetes bacterium]|nr:4Fe-4S binding protein [Spirochaetota bacterium]
MTTKDIYERLRERIDSYSIGMNATETGKELAILKRLFTEEEARYYLALTRALEPAAVIAGRLGVSAAEAEKVLERMCAKGHLFPKTADGVKLYAAAPFMHGFFEHQVYRKDRDPELPRLIEDYLMGGFIPKSRALRVVPVGVGLPDRKQVLPYDDVREIIMSKERIGLMHCACNHHMKSLGHECGQDTEVCIAFDFYAEYPIEQGFGRWIRREEALKVVERAAERGLVHQAGGDSRNVECICNCCSDCCGILRMLKRVPNAGRFLSSNYAPAFDAGACTSCGECAERCPMGAITAGDGVKLNADRCIGCGVCAVGCPAGAVTLQKKPDDLVRRPPSPEKYTFMRSSIDFRADQEAAKGKG